MLLDEAELADWAARLASGLQAGTVIFLQGDLGAGKTTLARALLRALGWQGSVKSPTYTLVESYPLAAFTLHHSDLYRIAEADELEAIGLRDQLNDESVWLIEWPERGIGFLPEPDLRIVLSGSGEHRSLHAEAHSPRGQALLVAATAVTADRLESDRLL